MRDPEAEARRWLAAAGEELAWARYAADGGFHAPACFHAQQGAGKAVKAVHYYHGARVQTTGAAAQQGMLIRHDVLH